MSCAGFDELPAPTGAAHFHSSCYLFVGLTASLRQCASICESRGAAPVCPSSDEENDFVWSGVAMNGRHVASVWLGWYNESGGLSCVSPGADSCRCEGFCRGPCVAALRRRRASSPSQPERRRHSSDWFESSCDNYPWSSFKASCVCSAS